MAPRMHRDNVNTGDSSRYSLRTLRHCGHNFLHARDVDVSKINGKEDFFRSIGLQMRKFQYPYSTSISDHRIKKINIPHNVMLRDCRVVILGSTCEQCGMCFKCQTDLTVHLALKHQKYEKLHDATVEETQCTGTETETELCNIIRRPFDHTTIVTDKNYGTKLQKKLRITLRIGEEVVAKTSVKKKHLKINTVDICTQTEPPNETELVTGKGAHESVLSRIDPPVFGLYQCYNEIMHRVNGPNRYLVSDIVANEQTIVENVSTQVEPRVLNKYVTPHGPLTKLLPGLNSTNIIESSKLPEENETVTLDESSYDSRFSEKFKSNRSLEQIVQSNLKDNKESKQEININANGLQNDISISEEIKQSQTMSITVQLLTPVISSINVPNRNDPPSYIELTTQPTPLLQEQVEQHQQRLHQTQQIQQPQRQEQSRQEHEEQQIGNNTTGHVQGKDNEIQEVLRIVRGRSISTEINHESPNRFEQQILVQDAIRDMMRMEEEGWHLLEAANKRKRSTKSNVKTIDNSEDCVKRKKRICIKPIFENNVVKGPTSEKYISDKKEHVLKMQNCNNTITVCNEDSLKENLMIGNKNVAIPSEVLRLYGINYDNEVFEINNNTESLQGPVSCFPAPCSAGIENRGNRPIVIDLVNDTDE